jgi:16S rRNA (guanine(1405)-N(7))-methyltransferase
MRFHASTRERLPVIPAFYAEIARRVGPVQSVLDLACGLNPLALPWMALAPGARYLACDIYADLADFLNTFFKHIHMDGQAEVCDLTAAIPAHTVDVVLLLKTLPCLEQLDKSIGPRLLDAIQARHAIVSFPARSLGGRSKGMVQNYSRHFEELLEGRPWRVESWEAGSELVFWMAR